jgi:hypothetical protein
MLHICKATDTDATLAGKISVLLASICHFTSHKLARKQLNLVPPFIVDFV